MDKVCRRWRNPHLPAAAREGFTAFCRRAAELAGLPCDCSWVLDLDFVGDREMTRLNREIVGHEGTTDVITMSYFDEPDGWFEGDVALELIVNPDAAVREGAKRGTGYAYETALYVVHGMLHASGEDDLSPAPRRRMRRREREVMSVLTREFDLNCLFPEK